jgi:hypothetical protein
MTYSDRQGAAWTSPRPAKLKPSALLPAGPSCQPCPDCGGLECLCRPRFFAGQLLTEQDLNRLENYIVAKNRLHNRYLVGHGVVCGLEVTCSPCANTVSVASGYAIDPCGADIIVCSPDTVDICSLINACTPSTAVNCAPYKDNTPCADATQTWILAIRYMETPSRGVTPLTGTSQCSCGAGGSGACSCGTGAKSCGCGGAMSAAGCCGQTISPAAPIATNLSRRGAPASCEPTVTCEGYRYEVFPAPFEKSSSLIGGELLERLTCCLRSIFPNGIGFPTNLQDAQQLYNFCCALRQGLMQYLVSNGGADCTAIAKIQAISCPFPNTRTFWQDIAIALEAEIVLLFEIALDCFCSVALPPCPPPGDPRVPLAAVTVRTSDCAILSICDWTPLRKHVVTPKTLGYWFGWLPFAPLLRAFMLEACCNGFNFRDRETDRNQAAASDQATPQFAEESTILDQPIAFATTSFRASNPLSEAVAANLAAGSQTASLGDLLHAMLDPNPANASAQTPTAKILTEAVRPLFSAFGPILNAAKGRQDNVDAAAMIAMRAELDTLKATVTAQQTALDALRRP